VSGFIHRLAGGVVLGVHPWDRSGELGCDDEGALFTVQE
jgi:hypothetical protein